MIVDSYIYVRCTYECISLHKLSIFKSQMIFTISHPHRLKAIDIAILILLTFIILLQVFYTQLNRNDSVLSLITHLHLCKYSLFYTEKNNLLSY